MGIPRLSIAGLMTLIGLVAIDCATLVRAQSVVQSLDTAIFVLVGVLPIVNVVGIGLLLILQPSARRSPRIRHSTRVSGPER
jgi:hypothetical protein